MRRRVRAVQARFVRRRQEQRAVDDFEKRALAGDADLAARRANPLALERTRYYVIGDDGMLVLSTRYDDGKDAVVSRWKKGS